MSRALADVARNSTLQALTPTRLAQRLGVSLRHLQRAFEGSGMTVAHAIAIARLRTACLLLSSPGAGAITLADVAHRAGFRSTFELRSAFRGEYGVLPSEYRAAHASKLVTEDA
jgi:AraC-like DNA-binding protein